MAEYTYADVIIDPEDPRVEVGAEYYFADTPAEVVQYARENNSHMALLRVNKSVTHPFCIGENRRWPCIIRKKESKKKWVPFDLTNEEDRARLRGAWMRAKDDPRIEYQIISLGIKNICIDGGSGLINMDRLLQNWEFLDNTPCGKEVEE